MGLSRKLLGEGEVEILHLHSHVKRLFLPGFVLLVSAFAGGLGSTAMPADWKPWGNWVLWALVIVVVVVWVLLPILRWWTTTYTITDRRIITRRGIITRVGHDLPINRINDVSYSRGLLDRMLGCGTLALTTIADDPVYLHDVPGVERVRVAMTNLLFRSGEAAPKDVTD